jgi:large-conductance mechanosensitive channel
MSSWQEAIQRIGAVFAGIFALLLCMAFGTLISYLVRDYLSRSIKNGIDSLAINVDIHLPIAGYRDIHLQGNVILLICFIVGIAICFQQIKRAPGTRKVTRLTREQRMTPYERMLREKRELEKQKVAGNSLHAPCRNHPLLTIRPEAVNYMPME